MKFLLVLSLLLIIFIPRFWYFWNADFTGDEATHVKKAVSVATGIKSLVKLDNPSAALKNIYQPILEHNHPPFEFLALIPFGLIEPREFFTRLVYVLSGSFALVLSYFFVRSIFGRKIAGYFFIFFGTSAYAIWWSQTAIYINFAITAGVFITLSLVNFYRKPNGKSLLILFISEAFGLVVFHDFVFYLPSIIWIIWDRRSFLKKSDYIVPFALFLATAGVFYFSYIFYAFTIGPKYAGFNYVLNSKITAHADVVINIKDYMRNFFLYPGVVVLLPFSLMAFFYSEKQRYYKYLYPVLIIYIFVFVIKSPTPFHYLASTYGIYLLTAAIGVSYIGNKIRPSVISIIILVNFLGFMPIFGGKHNPQLFGDSYIANNNMKEIAVLAKRCFTSDADTYISSDDVWKMTYYFGRQSTVERDGTEARVATIRDFLAGKLNEVILIHVGNDLISQEEHDRLTEKAQRRFVFDNESVYIFKNCT